jgi:hypothetical protein
MAIAGQPSTCALEKKSNCARRALRKQPEWTKEFASVKNFAALSKALLHNLFRNSLNRTSCLFAAALIALGPTALHAKKPASLPEEIEWTREGRPPHPDPKLPNVLLLGDSISRNYFPQFANDLTGIANVYLMATSPCVANPRPPHQIAELARLESVPFRLVHFNNGMHGWNYTEDQYRAAFAQFLRSVPPSSAKIAPSSRPTPRQCAPMRKTARPTPESTSAMPSQKIWYRHKTFPSTISMT